MKKSGGLGRGLGLILPDVEISAVAHGVESTVSITEVPLEKIVHVGNAAGAGAALALADIGEENLAAFDKKCTYLELSSSKEFMENYVEYMAFDEDE